jgi:hypothetical protein
MSPILGIYASQISGHLVTSSYYSIATQTVGSGGASSITFSSIPSTYTHLQLRMFTQTNRATYGIDQLSIQFNGVSGTSYSEHFLFGDGSTAQSSGYASQSAIFTNYLSGTAVGGTFGSWITDILDYTNTNKNKTVRILAGNDINGTIAGYGGYVGLTSGEFYSTNAISSIVIAPGGGTQFNQYSSFALYGIK